MQPIAFCSRCRGMKVGWNRQYILHSLGCQEWISKSSRLLILTGLLSSFVFAFPVSTAVVAPPLVSARPAVTKRPFAVPGAEAAQVTRMLSRYGLDQERLQRVVQAIMTSSAKYKMDPRLVASIIIVESGADPFAVSSAESVGIMQIHIRTWGPIADKQNINLFKIEDNVDFGVRILHDYVAATGLWDGVARYLGRTGTPESQQAADEYVQKVRQIYGVAPENAS